MKAVSREKLAPTATAIYHLRRSATMSSQMDLQRELERIPRIGRGTLQNDFRHAWWFFRGQGKTFEERVTIALNHIRLEQPQFVPLILPDDSRP